MKILWISRSLNPTKGGPVTFVKQITVALGELGHLCEVVTLDVINTPGVREFPGAVKALGPSVGKYGFNTRLIPFLLQNAAQYNTVIVSGVWQYPSLATWLASKKVQFPYFVFTHGMLDPWFKVTYPLKHMKKWLYWPWADYRVLRDATAVLFTSEEERKSASKSFWLYKANEVVVNYGIGSPQGDTDYQRQIFLKKFPHLKRKEVFPLFRTYPSC